VTCTPVQILRSKLRYYAIKDMGFSVREAQRGRASLRAFLRVLAGRGISEAEAVSRFGELAQPVPPRSRGPGPLEQAFQLLGEWLQNQRQAGWHRFKDVAELTEALLKRYPRMVAVNADDMAEACGCDMSTPAARELGCAGHKQALEPLNLREDRTLEQLRADGDLIEPYDRDEALGNYCNQPHDFETEETRDDLNDSDEFEVNQ
jgi:hypothetical protein